MLIECKFSNDSITSGKSCLHHEIHRLLKARDHSGGNPPYPPFTKGEITSSEALVEAIATASNYPPLEKGGIEGGFEEIWTGDYVFENEWQSFRANKDRKQELISTYLVTCIKNDKIYTFTENMYRDLTVQNPKGASPRFSKFHFCHSKSRYPLVSVR